MEFEKFSGCPCNVPTVTDCLRLFETRYEVGKVNFTVTLACWSELLKTDAVAKNLSNAQTAAFKNAYRLIQEALCVSTLVRSDDHHRFAPLLDDREVVPVDPGEENAFGLFALFRGLQGPEIPVFRQDFPGRFDRFGASR